MQNTKRFQVVLLIISLTFLIRISFASAETNNSLLGKNGVVAYTWNSNPKSEKAILTTSSYTFNYGKTVSRTRLSPGVYQVTFEGLSCNRGQFTVNAYGGTEFKSCRIGSWNGKQDCEVSVYCFNAQGEALDSQFNLLFID